LFRLENHVCLSRGVQVSGAAWRAATRTVTGRSRVRVAPCAVCTCHVETRSANFLVEPQNQGRRFVSGLASKPAATVFSCLASKLVATVSPGLASKPTVSFFVEPQNQGGGGFPGLCLKIGSSCLVIWASKITATVS
jgi:hypothetical protein